MFTRRPQHQRQHISLDTVFICHLVFASFALRRKCAKKRGWLVMFTRRPQHQRQHSRRSASESQHLPVICQKDILHFFAFSKKSISSSLLIVFLLSNSATPTHKKRAQIFFFFVNCVFFSLSKSTKTYLFGTIERNLDTTISNMSMAFSHWVYVGYKLFIEYFHA